MVNIKTNGGVSIGTGMALEAIFEVEDRYDDSREIPDKVDINDYDLHIYNLHTIVRNVVNAMERPNEGYREEDLMSYVVRDINRINEYYKDSICKPVLSIIDYSSRIKSFNKTKEIKMTKGYLNLSHLNSLIQIEDIREQIDMSTVKDKGFDFGSSKILMTTSFLFDFDIYGKVDLLESHTGKLIKPHKLNKKYKTIAKPAEPGKRRVIGAKVDLSHLPYNKLIHMVLGDSTYVLPADLKDRKLLISLAEKWTPRTTDGVIRETFIKNKELRKFIK